MQAATVDLLKADTDASVAVCAVLKENQTTWPEGKDLNLRALPTEGKSRRFARVCSPPIPPKTIRYEPFFECPPLPL